MPNYAQAAIQIRQKKEKDAKEKERDAKEKERGAKEKEKDAKEKERRIQDGTGAGTSKVRY